MRNTAWFLTRCSLRLKAKFSLFAAFFVVAVAVGLSILFLIFEARHLARRGREGQISLARDSAEICRESIIMDDELFALNYFNSAVQATGVLYLSFIDNTGTVQMHSDSSFIETVKDKEYYVEAMQSGDAILQSYENEAGEIVSVASTPVMVGDTRLGTALVGFSEGILRDSIRESMAATTRRIVIVTAIILFAGIIGSFIMAYTMIKPIDQLAGGARKIGNGELGYTIDVKTRDELGDLAKEFNTMALRLKELDEMKENFVYSLTHDLRSPLSAAMGYISLLLSGAFDPLSSKQFETLTDVKSICDRLLSLINDILDYAKIKSGKMEIDPAPADMRQLVEKIIQTLKPLGSEKNVELSCDLPEDSVEAVIDADKVERLTVNLISNALKFTPENGRVKVSLEKSEKDFTVAVADTGIGIPPDQIETIFGKFSQLKEHQKHSRIKGTGIGLSIAKAIVEAHGGKIWVESKENEGTVFYYTIPLKNPDPVKKEKANDTGREEEYL